MPDSDSLGREDRLTETSEVASEASDAMNLVTGRHGSHSCSSV